VSIICKQLVDSKRGSVEFAAENVEAMGVKGELLVPCCESQLTQPMQEVKKMSEDKFGEPMPSKRFWRSELSPAVHSEAQESSFQ